MGYFPFFMEIEDKKGVVLGGGQVAARKVEKLLPFGPRLICIAPVICGSIESLAQGSDQLTLIYREACREDMEGACFVIAATDREDVNAWAAQWCRERQLPKGYAAFFPIWKGNRVFPPASACASPLL